MKHIDTILIDGNALGRRMDAAMNLSVGGMKTGAIFGFIKAVGAMKAKYPKVDILTLWDGRAQWRYDLYPGYKGNREAKTPKEAADDAAYKKQVSIIRKGLEYLGVRQLCCATEEADDMAGYFTRALAATGKRTLVVTGDKDWLQLVDDNTDWYDPMKDLYVTMDNLFDETGYRNGRAFLDGKVLMGDSSDTIPPVGGIGEKGAPVFIAEFGSVKEFFAKVDSGEFVPKKAAHTKLASPEGRAKYELNYKLMNLLDTKKPKSENVSVIKGRFDEEKFRNFCERLAFNSFLRDWTPFTTPFKPAAIAAAN